MKPLLGDARYFSLGRHALVAALRAAGVGAGDAVLLPEFICRDVLAAIHAVGARPCWYPVGADLGVAVGQDAWPSARAVIAVNYFGFPQALGEFRDYAGRTGAVLIEDNAHGFLSRDTEGRWLGMRGDLGIFSLRKTLAMADGAALTASGPRFAALLPPPLSESGAGYSPAAARKGRLRRIALLGPSAARLGTAMVRGVRRLRTGRAIPIPGEDAETAIPHPPFPHHGLARELAAVDRDAEIGRRRRLYRLAVSEVGHAGGEPVFPDLPEGVAPYGLPFRTESATALRRIAAWAAHRGLDLFRWPDLPDALAATAPDYHRKLHVVNFLW